LYRSKGTIQELRGKNLAGKERRKIHQKKSFIIPFINDFFLLPLLGI